MRERWCAVGGRDWAVTGGLKKSRVTSACHVSIGGAWPDPCECEWKGLTSEDESRVGGWRPKKADRVKGRDVQTAPTSGIESEREVLLLS